MDPHPKLHPLKGDVYDKGAIGRMIENHNAIISAFNPGWNTRSLQPTNQGDARHN
jgi:uncharacterized protein